MKKVAKITKICEVCGTEFSRIPSEFSHGRGRFCSHACSAKAHGVRHWLGKKMSAATRKKMSLSRTGDKHPMFGKKLSKETLQKISASLVGKRKGADSPVWESKHHLWLGDDVGYKSLHHWINRRLGKHPAKCEFCGIEGKMLGKKQQRWSIQYANKSRKYKRDVNDWLRLCGRCHRKYDSASP